LLLKKNEQREPVPVGFLSIIDAEGKAKPKVYVVGEFDRCCETIGELTILNNAGWGETNNWILYPAPVVWLLHGALRW
jgi:hypothetical protein